MIVTNAAAALVGILAMAAVLMIVTAFRRPQPDLAWALQNLSSAPILESGRTLDPTSRVEKLGAWGATHLSMGPTHQQRALLRLRGISDLEFIGTRLLYVIVLASLPLLGTLTFVAVGVAPPLYLPPIAILGSALLGWFLPVLQLRRQATATTSDSGEALLTFIDLVVLERLSNASAVDAITRAAFLSDNPLFIQIQQATNRAALENVAPWKELDALAEAINLPQLADVARIAQLQNEGASMAGPLRARVAELRNAYLLRTREENVKITQRMDIIQMLPVTAILIVFIAAPLLNLMLGA